MILLRFHPAAQEEVYSASSYYENEAPDLGIAFLEELEKVLDLLESFPESGFQLAPGVRRLLLRRFPYSVLYELHDAHVLILAIMHQHRKPGYWKSRLQ